MIVHLVHVAISVSTIETIFFYFLLSKYNLMLYINEDKSSNKIIAKKFKLDK